MVKCRQLVSTSLCPHRHPGVQFHCSIFNLISSLQRPPSKSFPRMLLFLSSFFFCNAVVKDLSPESPWEGETEQIACESSNLTFPPFELLDYFLYSFVFCRSATLITPGILLEMKNLGIKTSDGYFIGTLTYLHWGVSDVLSSLTLGPC